ncbi:MAG: hypothetical protein LBB14_03580, partial [Puniceicoccales bacterium]|nr:hypothetical protein [Puniceicoccales bacterium]
MSIYDLENQDVNAQTSEVVNVLSGYEDVKFVARNVLLLHAFLDDAKRGAMAVPQMSYLLEWLNRRALDGGVPCVGKTWQNFGFNTGDVLPLFFSKLSPENLASICEFQAAQDCVPKLSDEAMLAVTTAALMAPKFSSLAAFENREADCHGRLTGEQIARALEAVAGGAQVGARFGLDRICNKQGIAVPANPDVPGPMAFGSFRKVDLLVAMFYDGDRETEVLLKYLTFRREKVPATAIGKEVCDAIGRKMVMVGDNCRKMLLDAEFQAVQSRFSLSPNGFPDWDLKQTEQATLGCINQSRFEELFRIGSLKPKPVIPTVGVNYLEDDLRIAIILRAILRRGDYIGGSEIPDLQTLGADLIVEALNCFKGKPALAGTFGLANGGGDPLAMGNLLELIDKNMFETLADAGKLDSGSELDEELRMAILAKVSFDRAAFGITNFPNAKFKVEQFVELFNYVHCRETSLTQPLPPPLAAPNLAFRNLNFTKTANEVLSLVDADCFDALWDAGMLEVGTTDLHDAPKIAILEKAFLNPVSFFGPSPRKLPNSAALGGDRIALILNRASRRDLPLSSSVPYDGWGKFADIFKSHFPLEVYKLLSAHRSSGNQPQLADDLSSAIDAVAFFASSFYSKNKNSAFANAQEWHQAIGAERIVNLIKHHFKKPQKYVDQKFSLCYTCTNAVPQAGSNFPSKFWFIPAVFSANDGDVAFDALLADSRKNSPGNVAGLPLDVAKALLNEALFAAKYRPSRQEKLHADEIASALDDVEKKTNLASFALETELKHVLGALSDDSFDKLVNGSKLYSTSSKLTEKMRLAILKHGYFTPNSKRVASIGSNADFLAQILNGTYARTDLTDFDVVAHSELAKTNEDCLLKVATKETFRVLNDGKQLDTKTKRKLLSSDVALAILKFAFFCQNSDLYAGRSDLSTEQIVAVLNDVDGNPNARDVFGGTPSTDCVKSTKANVLAVVDGEIYQKLHRVGELADGSQLNENTRLALLQRAFFCSKNLSDSERDPLLLDTSDRKEKAKEFEASLPQAASLTGKQIFSVLRSLYGENDLSAFGLGQTFQDALPRLFENFVRPVDPASSGDSSSSSSGSSSSGPSGPSSAPPPKVESFYRILKDEKLLAPTGLSGEPQKVDVSKAKYENMQISIAASALFTMATQENVPLVPAQVVAVIECAVKREAEIFEKANIRNADGTGTAVKNLRDFVRIVDWRTFGKIWRNLFPEEGSQIKVDDEAVLALAEKALFHVEPFGRTFYDRLNSDRLWRVFIKVLNRFATADRPTEHTGMGISRSQMVRGLPPSLVERLYRDGQLGGQGYKTARTASDLDERVRKALLAYMIFDSDCPFRQRAGWLDRKDFLTVWNDLVPLGDTDEFGTNRNISAGLRFLSETEFDPPFDYSGLADDLCDSNAPTRDAVLHHLFFHCREKVSMKPNQNFGVIERAFLDSLPETDPTTRLSSQVPACDGQLDRVLDLLTRDELADLAEFSQNLLGRGDDKVDENRRAVCVAILQYALFHGDDGIVRALSGESLFAVAHRIARGTGWLQGPDGQGKRSFAPDMFGLRSTMADLVDKLLEEENGELKFEGLLRAFVRKLYSSRGGRECAFILWGRGADSEEAARFRALAPRWSEAVSMGGTQVLVPEVSHTSLLLRLLNALNRTKVEDSTG